MQPRTKRCSLLEAPGSLLEAPGSSAQTPSLDSFIGPGEDSMQLMLDEMSNQISISEAGTSDVPATPNMKNHRPDKITDEIYVGNEHNARDTDLLQFLGITHILNCKSGSMPETPGIELCQIPLDDRGSSNLENNKFPAAFKFMDKALAKPGRKVLIHCQLGQNRSVTMAMGYLVHHNNMTLKDAYDTVMGARAIACVNELYAKKLIAYEKKKRGRNSIVLSEFVTTQSILSDLRKHPSLLIVGSNRQSISISATDPSQLSLLEHHPSMRIFAEFQKMRPRDNTSDSEFEPLSPSLPGPNAIFEDQFCDTIMDSEKLDKRLPTLSNASDLNESQMTRNDKPPSGCCIIS